MAPDRNAGPLGADSGDTDHQNDLHHDDQVTLDPSGLGRQGGALADILLADAVELAEHHWKVFPLRGKVPAIRRAHYPTHYMLRWALSSW